MMVETPARKPRGVRVVKTDMIDVHLLSNLPKKQGIPQKFPYAPRYEVISFTYRVLPNYITGQVIIKHEPYLMQCRETVRGNPLKFAVGASPLRGLPKSPTIGRMHRLLMHDRNQKLVGMHA